MTPGSGFFGVWPGTAERLLADTGVQGLPSAATAAGTARGAAWSEADAPDGQACWVDAGEFGLAFHGELYNGQALRSELGLAGSTTLAELLCAVWRRLGVAGLQRLDGLYAVAVFSHEGLWLLRDASGQRNLYLHVADPGSGRVAFATHLDTLLRLPGVPRRVDRRSLHEYLRFLDISAPNTLYAGVRAVESGQLLQRSATGVETASRPEAALDTPTPASFEEAVEQLGELLQQAVSARLAGAARPAAFLSGGIDSSLLCALAATQRRDVTAVTVGFDKPPFDEGPVAQRVAQHLGMRHEVLRFEPAQYLQAFETLSRHLEQPMADPATPATVLVYGHCRSHFDAVLDGMGADEASGVMPPRHVRLAVGHASRLPPPLRRGLVGLMRRLPVLAGYTPIFDFEHPADLMIRWGGFTRAEVQDLCGEPVSFAHTTFYRSFARYPRHAHFERFTGLLDSTPSDRLNQATLITGAPARFPFWDRRTDRYTRALPKAWRYLPSAPKRLLRTLLARHVPPSIWDQPKHGFDFPLQAFLSADDFALVRRHLDPGRWVGFGLLDAQLVGRYAQRFMAGEPRLVFRIWTLTVLGAWLEHHGELHGGAPAERGAA